MFSTSDEIGERSLVLRHDLPQLRDPITARPSHDERFDLARVDPTATRVAELFQDLDRWKLLQREALGVPLDAPVPPTKIAVGIVAGRISPDANYFEERVVASFRCEITDHTKCVEVP